MAKSLFDPQHSLWHWMGKIPEFFLLSSLWLLLSLPVVTLIPASVALYDAVARCLRPDEKGVYRRFFRTFWKELGRGLLLSLIWVPLAVLLLWGNHILTMQVELGRASAFAFAYQVSFLLPIAVLNWLVALESRFVYGYWQLQKTAVAVMLSYLPYTGVLLLVLAGAVALCTYVPVLIFLVPAVAATVQSVTIEKVFRKMLQEEEQ